MKRVYLTTLIIFIFAISKSFGQKLEENKKDDFTNKPIKRTSWETLYTTMTANAYFRFSSVGDSEFFDLKYQDGTVFSINKDDEMMFKLDNGEIVTIHNLEYQITCNGCGSKGLIGSQVEGIQVSYALDKDAAEKLKAHKIVKIRYVITGGLHESDVKDKVAAKIITSLNLI